MREIVKRETIETSIVGGRSATRWGNSARRAFGHPRVSVSLGSWREVGGRWGCALCSTLYSLRLAQGTRTEVCGRSTLGLSPIPKA